MSDAAREMQWWEHVNWNAPHWVKITVRDVSTVVGNVAKGSVVRMPGTEARRLCQWANPPLGELADELAERWLILTPTAASFSPETVREMEAGPTPGPAIVLPEAKREPLAEVIARCAASGVGHSLKQSRRIAKQRATREAKRLAP